MPQACAASYAPMPDLLHVAAIHRRTYPDSNSYIVTGADKAEYALKAFSPDLAREHAFYEAYISILGTQVGLSMAHWTVLQVDDQSCRRDLSTDKISRSSNGDLSVGTYFGSRVLDGPGTARSYLSAKSLKSHPAIARQLGWIMLFDVWIGYFGIRSYTAFTEKDYPAHIYFHGHSGAFSPEYNTAFNERVASRYAEACRITGDARIIHHFLALINRVDDTALMQAVHAVPGIWRNAALEARVINMLRSRRTRLIAALRGGVTAASRELPVELLCDTARSKVSRPPAPLA